MGPFILGIIVGMFIAFVLAAMIEDRNGKKEK